MYIYINLPYILLYKMIVLLSIQTAEMIQFNSSSNALVPWRMDPFGIEDRSVSSGRFWRSRLETSWPAVYNPKRCDEAFWQCSDSSTSSWLHTDAAWSSRRRRSCNEQTCSHFKSNSLKCLSSTDIFL